MIPRDRGLLPRPSMAALLLLAACGADDALTPHIEALDDPDRRERAIDALVTQVRRAPETTRPALQQRAVYALMEAYRRDHRRGQIISALALLADRRASEVFIAALDDADRRGPYYDAAVLAARTLGKLAIADAVPALGRVVQRCRDSREGPRSSIFESAAIDAIAQIGSRDAIPALIAVVRADPAACALQLKRQAIVALGRLKAITAFDLILDAATSEPLRRGLRQATREALCRLGPGAARRLTRLAAQRDEQQRPLPRAIAAATLLGEMSAAPSSAARADDPPRFRLALAATRLRYRHDEAAGDELAALATEPNVATDLRRRAVELLGWHGSSRWAGSLLALIEGRRTPPMLRSAAALAYARTAVDPEPLRRAFADRAQQVRLLAAYLPRLQLAARCGVRASCYRQALDQRNWRVQERAVLEIGRHGGPALRAAVFVSHYSRVAPSVRLALLTAVEGLRPPELRQQVARTLVSALESAQEPPGLRVRARCLIEAWRVSIRAQEQR